MPETLASESHENCYTQGCWSDAGKMAVGIVAVVAVVGTDIDDAG